MNMLTNIDRRPVLWAFVVTYFAGVSLLHLRFSNWLVTPSETALGVIRLADYLPAAMLCVLVAATVLVAHQAWTGTRRGPTLFYWGLWAGAVVVFDHTLLVTPNEYAHYPQYALLTYLLAYGLDPQRQAFVFGRVLFWTTALGVVDEANQYFYLTASFSDYLDFNDFLLNLLGAAAGLLLFYGFRVPRGHAAKSWRRFFRDLTGPSPERALLAGVVGACTALALAGILRITPPAEIPPGGVQWQADALPRIFLERQPGIMGSWQPAPHRGRYYVLTPWQGTVLLVLAGVAFGSFSIRAPALGRQTPLPDRVR